MSMVRHYRLRMASLTMLVVVVLLAAGCFAGGSRDGGVSSSPSESASVIRRADTAVTLWMPVGLPARNRSDVASMTCPSAAHCMIAQIVGTTPNTWVLVAKRHLTCSPSGGGYSDPQAACRALTDFLKPWPHTVCFCPALAQPPFEIIGRYRGRERQISFDRCRLCGAPGHIQSDFSVLFGS